VGAPRGGLTPGKRTGLPGDLCTVSAAPTGAAAQAVGTICHSDLPSQAYHTLKLIAQGGPYPYSQDGSVFCNREDILPSQPSGYYHE
jgi:ribonuclease T1